MSEHDPIRKATLAALGLPGSRALDEVKRSLGAYALEDARRASKVEHGLRAQEAFRRTYGSLTGFEDEYRAALAPLRHVEEQLRAAMGSGAGLSDYVRVATEPLSALQEQWQATTAPLQQLRASIGAGDLTPAQLRAIRGPFNELQYLQGSVLDAARYDHSASWAIPERAHLRQLGMSAAAITAPLAFEQAKLAALGRSLAKQMGAVGTPWALEQAPDVSAAAFARVSNHVQNMLGEQPFTQRSHAAALALFGGPLAENAITETSGEPEVRDDARVDSGADTALFVIPSDARLPVGRAVGLVVPPPKIPVIRPLGTTEDFSFSSEAEAWLRATEVKLRYFVVGVLKAAHGDRWLRALPPGMAEGWERNRAKQLASGRPEYELFHYAELGDWIQVINRNWRGGFVQAFKKKAYLETAFDHLVPLRNEDGHHRPMAATDQLIIVAFARMLLDRMEAYYSAEGMGTLGE